MLGSLRIHTKIESGNIRRIDDPYVRDQEGVEAMVLVMVNSKQNGNTNKQNHA